MIKITVEGIEINFNDLTEQKQKEIYEKNKNKYKQEASKSIYVAVRIMVAKAETESSQLNKMLIQEIEDKQDDAVENAIFENVAFEIEEETIKQLATSSHWRYRKKAAELSKDSKLLNQMLRKEMNGKKDNDVENAIFANEAFEIEEETIKQLATSSYWGYRRKAAELSKSSKFLNEMLRKEVEGEQEDVVEKRIFANVAFEIEEETIKQLATSSHWRYRRKAAELSKSSKFLNEMLRNEVNGKKNEDVENAIFANEAFEIEEETIKQLETSSYWGYRRKAAELSKSSKFLNEMLRKEVEGEQDDDVENTIFANVAFEIEEETIKQLATSNYYGYRRKAAELSKSSKFLNEMLRKEVEGEQDEEVENAIFANVAFEIEEETIKLLVTPGYCETRMKIAELLKKSNLLFEMFINEVKSEQCNKQVLETIIKNDLFEKTSLLGYIQNNY